MQPLITVFSLLTVVSVPGWVLLRLLQNNNGIFGNKVHIFVITFTLSLTLTGIFFALYTFSPIKFAPLSFSAIYLAISSVPVLKHIILHKFGDRIPFAPHQPTKYRLFDILLLIWILIFFSFSIGVFYPEMSKVSTLDIVSHYSQSMGFILTPDVADSVYPLYYFLLASVIQLSESPMVIFQTLTACLSLVLILSFYAMAKVYLIEIDRRMPLWATILFSVFSGFGWLYYLQKVPFPSDLGNNIQTLNLIVAGTYYDVGYGPTGGNWFWLRPVTLGLTILFVLLFLLRNQTINKKNYTLICSLLLIALSQIHFPEYIILIVLIFIITILVPRTKLRLKETTLSIVISLAAYVAVSYAYADVFTSPYFSSQISIALGALVAVSFTLSRFGSRPFSQMKFQIKNTHLIAVMLSVLYIYLVMLFHWFLDTGNFDSYTSLVKLLTVYGVPWQFYPMLLGVTGIAAIIGIPILIKRHKDRPVLIFVALFISMIFIGRLITYVGSEFALTGYFERRLVFHVSAAASILAPIGIFAIIGFLDRLQKSLGNLIIKPRIVSVAFISFFVVVGTLSTFLSIEYQIDYIKKYGTSDSKIEAVQGSVNRNPYSTLLTVSPQSYHIAKFSSPGYLIGQWSNQIWPSKSPELPLNIMSIYNSSFVYIQGNDSQILNERYRSGYLNEHILAMGPVVLDDRVQRMIQLPKLSPPVEYTDSLVLVLPDIGKASQRVYYAYDMLSLANYNYTTVLLSDVPSLRNAKVVLAPNEYIASKLIQYKKAYGLQYDKLVVLNLDGYGRLWAELTQMGSRNASISHSIKLDTSYTKNENASYNTNTLSLPKKIQVIDYVAKANVEQVATYENTSVPFILHKNGGDNLDVFYININPIVRAGLPADDNSARIFTFFQKVLDLLPGLNPPIYERLRFPSPYSLTSGGVAAFDYAVFRDDIELNSSTAIIYNYDRSPIELVIDDRKSTLEDVIRIIPISIQNLTVKGENGGTLDGGYGFYSSINMNESSIIAKGKPVKFLVESRKYNQDITTDLVTGKEIQFTLSKSGIVSRQPKLLSSGITELSGFYAYGELYNRVPSTGQDKIIVQGKSSFAVDYSDQFTIISSASFEGKFLNGQLAYTYDELGSLSNILSIPYSRHLVALAVILAVIGVYLVDKENSRSKRLVREHL